MKKEKYTFTLKTNDNGRREEVSHPEAPKDLITALLILTSWAERKDGVIIPAPHHLEMHAATQNFIRTAAKYRATVEAERDV